MMKKYLPVFLTFCLLLTAVSTGFAQNKKQIKAAKALEQQGDQAFRAKDFKLAIDKYAQSIVIVPVSPSAHFWKGFSHYNLTEFDSALEELNKAAEQNFNKPFEIYRLRANIYFQQKNFDASLEDIKKGLQLVPNEPNLTLIKGDISFAKNDFQSALDAYTQAVKFQPNNGDLEYFIAQSDLNLGKTQEQGVAAQSAIKKGTKYLGEAFFLVGDSLQKQKKFVEALEFYRQSLISKPDQYTVYRTMADIYRQQSLFQDAIEISKKGLIKYPNDGNFYTDLSWYYSLANQPDNAVQAALAAVRFLPQQSLGFTNLCRAYNDTTHYQLAVNACNKALNLTPNDGETYFYLARANAALGKSADAVKNYDKAVTGLEVFTQNNPDYSDGFYLLGNAYYEDNQIGKAIEAYKKCLEISPNFSKARFNLGIVYNFNKNKAGATEQYTALLGIDKTLAAKLKAEIDKK